VPLQEVDYVSFISKNVR